VNEEHDINCFERAFEKKGKKISFFLTAIRVQEGLRGNDATKENFFDRNCF